MRWSQTYLFTVREAPADAEIMSHQLLVRAGFIKKLAPGIFTLQNFGLRSLRKIENIIRAELDKKNCTELLMPMVQPQELWEETGRLNIDVLLKFKNRNGQLFCLGPTHEEVVTDIIRKDVKSYRDLPKILYQIQTKYRDEIRPRFGLMRGREFIMKDAYSFDIDESAAHQSYQKMKDAYEAIFTRSGLNYRIVEADAGNIGGNMTHEFQVLAEAGEDQIVSCDSCQFAANIEVAPSGLNQSKAKPPEFLKLEEFATPNLKTIGDLSKSLDIPEQQLVKTLFYMGVDGPVAILLRGADEANPVKVKSTLGLSELPMFLTEEEVLKVSGASPGSCGPVGLKIPIYLDQALQGATNMIVGANKDGWHLKNVNIDRDFQVHQFADFKFASEGETCVRCQKGKYILTRGIEVGHIFYLGTKYSKAMGANYLNKEGRPVPVEMGCYGIGVTRALQASVEQNHDKDGIIWPVPIAPYHVHICLLDLKHELSLKTVETLESSLQKAGLEVFIDDREERPGIKFKDADLLGLPLRITIGARGLEAGEVELVERKTKKMHKLAPEKVVDFCVSYIQEGLR